MDNKDEKEKNMSEDQPEGSSSENRIPLWLQGLEDDDHEVPTPFDPKEDVKDSWVPEIEETIEDHQINNEEELGTPNEFLDSEILDQSADDHEKVENEPTEEILIDRLPNGEDSEDISPSLDDLPTSEGFLDISEMEFPSSQEPAEPIIEEEALIEGDLPEWLQEMISEQDDSTTDEPEHEFDKELLLVDAQEYVHDPTPLDQIPTPNDQMTEIEHEAADDLEEIEKTEFVDDIPSDEDSISLTEPAYLDEVSIAIAEDATTPIVISREDDQTLSDLEAEPIAKAEPIEESAPVVEEEPIAETKAIREEVPFAEEAPIVEEEPIVEAETFTEVEPLTGTEPIAEALPSLGIDEQLDLARQHLDQDDFDNALPIISELLENPVHIDTLEMWIKKATDGEANTNSKAWELCGDITLRQNKPVEAFDAYAKAIKLLLTTDEAIDEIR